MKRFTLSLFALSVFCFSCGADAPVTDDTSADNAEVATSTPATERNERAISTENPKTYNRNETKTAATFSPSAGAKAEKTGWLAFHQSNGAPTLSWSDFTASDTTTVKEFAVVDYVPADGFYDLATPDATDRRRVDIYGYEAKLRKKKGGTERVGSPDSAVLLIEGDLVRQLLYCGTPCTYESVFWSGPQEVTVLGKVITNDNENFHPYAWRIDLARQRVVTFKSNKMLGAESDFIATQLK